MPSITLDLKELLEVLWGSKPAFSCSPEFANKIRSTDPNSTFCHVEWKEGDGPYAAIWRLADWRTEYAKYIQDKEKSDGRVAAFNKKKEVLEGLCQALSYLGLDSSMTANMARKLYDTKNVVSIKHLTGIEYTKEELI